MLPSPRQSPHRARNRHLGLAGSKDRLAFRRTWRCGRALALKKPVAGQIVRGSVVKSWLITPPWVNWRNHNGGGDM